MRALILTLALLTAAAPARAADSWTGRLIRVVDGDTLYVAGPDGPPVRVRLYGIDAPELDQPGGKTAALELQTWIREWGDGNVKVIPVSTDQDGNTIAQVWANEMNLGQVLIDEHLARKKP